MTWTSTTGHGDVIFTNGTTPTTTATYSISGTITSGGSALSGVTVRTTGGSTTTDASGAYTIGALTNGSYTLTPAKTGYTFTPTTLAVTVNNTNVTGKDYTATAASTGGTLQLLFADNLNDNSIDLQKWVVFRGSNRVAEEDGIMKLEATVTDQWGYIQSQWIPINSSKPITITRKTKQHFDSYYNYYNANFRIQLDQAPNYDFGMYYSNATWRSAPYCDAYGFFIFKNNSNTETYNTTIGENSCSARQISAAIPAVWDHWFDEKMVYTPTTGQFEYFINNVKKADFNVGVVPSLSQYRIRLVVTPAGWWTGHYHYFDDISVSQAM